jgi:hypothetical protein
LTASLLSEFPLERLAAVDNFELRRSALHVEGQKSNVESIALQDLRRSTFDLVYELSGSPSALNDAIAHAAFSGRIVIGSWYGQKRAEIDLGGAFHRSRIRLISSQVSTISPELSGRWDKSRRFEVAWQALERIQPEKWITHRFSLNDAEKAYQLLDEHPQETIQVVFNNMKFNRLTLDNCHTATGIVLIIDVLRAFSTAAYAFSRGAKQIHLVSGVQEALDLKAQLPKCKSNGRSGRTSPRRL